VAKPPCGNVYRYEPERGLAEAEANREVFGLRLQPQSDREEFGFFASEASHFLQIGRFLGVHNVNDFFFRIYLFFSA
jgi:hypothetical protein